jgi:5-methylcytosine-specific restriction endonuclease McrA
MQGVYQHHSNQGFQKGHPLYSVSIGEIMRGKPRIYGFKKGNKVNLGRIQSPETKLKISLANKGSISWNKGLKVDRVKYPQMGAFGKRTEEQRKTISIGHKGQISWNKGKKCPQFSKENNPSWKGGTTPQNKIDRNRFRKTIQKLVFERDNYTCQICGQRGIELQVDHIQEWSECVELRFNIDNCRTLCKKCHYLITFNKPMETNKPWGNNFKYYSERGIAL